MTDKRKLRQWQKELRNLSDETGITLEEVTEYIGADYNKNIGFYVKLPMKRRTFIGIGMAFRQPLEVINRWIVYYGLKRRLYSKDISEDMVWIYLIHRNETDDSDINYYKMYEEYQRVCFETYFSIWSSMMEGSRITSDVDSSLKEIAGQGEAENIENFVINNIDSFKTAYARPRRLLGAYVKAILETNGRSSSGNPDPLNSLRGWLDDSMINYLSGAAETINVSDLRTKKMTYSIKHIPKSRKSHISLAMALGMTTEDINRYLELMGYLPLDDDNTDEAVLIRELDYWEKEHPLQRQFKETIIETAIESAPGRTMQEADMMDLEDMLKAVNDMLMLRQDLKAIFRRKKCDFIYLK